MKKYLFVIFIQCLFVSCNDESDLIVLEKSVTGLDIAIKLKNWSMRQSQPFVVCSKGDTSGLGPYYYDDLVSNIKFDSLTLEEFLLDTLFINTRYANRLEYNRTTSNLESIYNSININYNEEQMLPILNTLDLQLRMMNYDSSTYSLIANLRKWAIHQFPPRKLWDGHYAFIISGPNFSGYSGSTFGLGNVQNLEYFTRKIDFIELKNIVEKIDTSISFSQLKNIMSPIANVQMENTQWGPE